MPSADTSGAERIRRLKAKTIAVAVSNGVTLPSGGGYDSVAALKLGNSPAVVETPGGAVLKPGCGCGASQTLTCGGSATVLVPTTLIINVAAGQQWQLTYPTLLIQLGNGPQTLFVSDIGAYSLTCTV